MEVVFVPVTVLYIITHINTRFRVGAGSVASSESSPSAGKK
jgi:hypothetical protein